MYGSPTKGAGRRRNLQQKTNADQMNLSTACIGEGVSFD